MLSGASRRLWYQRYLNRLFTEFDHNMSKRGRSLGQGAVWGFLLAVKSAARKTGILRARGIRGGHIGPRPREGQCNVWVLSVGAISPM